ncbi:DUF1574 domain-containing protein [Hyella patelloides]|nr:DUF1574 domain-containing protein [Hyella patelloides]
MTIPVFSVGLFNWLIDPQDIFKSPNYWKINHEKINKDNNDRLFKAVDIIRLQPENIIMGSSRTKQGIDPESSALGKEQNFYNLAINGPNFYEARRYIEHAIHNQPELKEIILGVDFFMFNQDLENQPTFNSSRLEKNHLIFDDAVKNLFSLDVVNNSLETIKASQNSPDTVDDDYGDDGFMPNRNFNNGQTIWRFNQSIKLYFSLHSNYQFSESYWNDFKQIVQLCRENNIELKVFLSPAHATQWESIYTTKRWDVFEQWKRELVKIIPVWDFSGYNSITTEPIAKYMDNYVDSSHYTPEIGNLILQRMLDKQTDEIPQDFGTIINQENIEQHLANIKSDRQKWLKNNPEEVDLVRKFYAEINQDRNE